MTITQTASHMMIGLLLSSWRRFFVSGVMILEYSLVTAEGWQRQN